ncbi:hypothetical protein [Achromobacter sp. GD03932]|uniref:hypothetical protein n=1 Tax=Achromobacter sp. GD03932 TaxID=2975407 RepID=UPI00244C70FE|nr:hypothetical protein [Achromobacter sp. GD03932]MDH1299665.1 hypothetical protein [Achromobacter sp. GD03932]
MEEVTLFPQWRQAVQDFFDAGFNPGHVITHAWLERAFGMEPVEPEAQISAAAFQERQFEWLRNVEAFKSELLERHQVLLVSVHGAGYRWVPANEQTEVAQDRFEKDAARTYRKAAMALKHVRLGELTDSERQTNTDAIARLAMLRGMHKSLE